MATSDSKESRTARRERRKAEVEDWIDSGLDFETMVERGVDLWKMKKRTVVRYVRPALEARGLLEKVERVAESGDEARRAKEDRIVQIEAWLVERRSRSWIVLEGASRWGVHERTIGIYLKEARRRIKAAADETRADRIARHIAYRERIVLESLSPRIVKKVISGSTKRDFDEKSGDVSGGIDYEIVEYVDGPSSADRAVARATLNDLNKLLGDYPEESITIRRELSTEDLVLVSKEATPDELDSMAAGDQEVMYRVLSRTRLG